MAYSSHPPVVVVLIVISRLCERKGAIITCQVANKTYQHLQQIEEWRSVVTLETHKYTVFSPFPEVGARQERRSC